MPKLLGKVDETVTFEQETERMAMYHLIYGYLDSAYHGKSMYSPDYLRQCAVEAQLLVQTGHMPGAKASDVVVCAWWYGKRFTISEKD